MFERLREAIKSYRESKGGRTGGIVESSVVTAISAGAAGSVAAVVTTPVDVVKTTIMLAAGEESLSSSSSSSERGSKGRTGKNGLVDAFGGRRERRRGKSKGAWVIGKEIVQEKGLKGLWRGGALRAVWTFVGSGLYLGAYDAGRIYLARRRGEEVGEGELM